MFSKALLLPFGVGALVLIVLPAVVTIGLAFTLYDAQTAPVWRGNQNFIDLFTIDPIFPIAARNTLIFTAVATPLRVLGALGLALLLSPERRGARLYRSGAFLPAIVPEIAYALAWVWVLNPVYGPLNQILGAFGLPQPAWLGAQETALSGLVLAGAFQLGEGMVILIAGLKAVPNDLYRAASVDGAGRWARFWRITFPLIQPWLAVLLIRDLLWAAQGTFTLTRVMTLGGPYYSTLLMPLYIYEEAFDRFRFGLGAAATVLLVMAAAAATILAFTVLRGWGFDDEA